MIPRGLRLAATLSACLLHFFCGSEISNPEQIIGSYSTSCAFSDVDSYTLSPSFGFYKGSKDMSLIESITFSREPPEEYDECWNADISNSGGIRGYLTDDSVVIAGDHIYANERCSYMFAAHNSYGDPLWSNLSSIDGLELLNTSHAENMKMMFAFCQLTELRGVEDWDVSNVKNFAGVFQGHDNSGDVPLEHVDVSRWDTHSAENMSHMFYGCAQMKHIPIERWDVSNVKIFSHMFADCYSLKEIDFSNWETSSVESFDAFLNDCRSLIEIDVGGLDTATCRQFSQMFEACTSLRRIVGTDKWDVSNASHYAFSETFHCCYSLESLDIGGWVCSPDNTARMFKDCRKLNSVDLSGFDMSSNYSDQEMFLNCYQLNEVAGHNPGD